MTYFLPAISRSLNTYITTQKPFIRLPLQQKAIVQALRITSKLLIGFCQSLKRLSRSLLSQPLKNNKPQSPIATNTQVAVQRLHGRSTRNITARQIRPPPTTQQLFLIRHLRCSSFRTTRRRMRIKRLRLQKLKLSLKSSGLNTKAKYKLQTQ